jgi:hypothetical protein
MKTMRKELRLTLPEVVKKIASVWLSEEEKRSGAAWTVFFLFGDAVGGRVSSPEQFNAPLFPFVKNNNN